ncbi:MAG: chemotaxis protein CheW [Dissulfurimicrobium sp.]|uniref:chemotaxis protein CheW n=1 Tax=Dissulfurimicrobium TaxID=1769732 RepID=UPI001EDC13F4|nr:chemotaxis protein CheW [Dissulfurimicrobium hydrothermale]UKL13983.1 chemotaxis protein CheW [Dissulfurimicrobium hydrothermale]
MEQSEERPGMSVNAPYHVVFFKLQRQTWAVGLDWVQEVLQPKGLGIMPNAHPVIAGLLNVRGQILPVLKVGEILMKRPMGDLFESMSALEGIDAQNRVLLIGGGEASIGIMVDSVIRIGSLNSIDTKMTNAGGMEPLWNADFVWGLAEYEDAVLPVLNVQRLVDHIKGLGFDDTHQADAVSTSLGKQR